MSASNVLSPGVTIAKRGYPTLVGEYGVRTDPSKLGRAARWMTNANDYAYERHFVGMASFNSALNPPDGSRVMDTERRLAFPRGMTAVQTASQRVAHLAALAD